MIFWNNYKNTSPEKIIVLNNIDYCWIYKTKVILIVEEINILLFPGCHRTLILPLLNRASCFIIYLMKGAYLL
jgi:hypothetical protein